MSYGLEFTNADGVARLTPEDFVDRLATSGTLTLVLNPSTLQYEASVSVSGMADDGTWAISAFGYDCRPVIESGGFKVISPQPYGTYRYAVYRR